MAIQIGSFDVIDLHAIVVQNMMAELWYLTYIWAYVDLHGNSLWYYLQFDNMLYLCWV